MSAGYQLPKKLLEQIRNDFGKNPAAWPEELRDIVNPSIEARDIAPPLSGTIREFLNTDYHYHWAGPDRGGVNEEHSRVQSLLAAGWTFADTNDVKMASEETVRGRNNAKTSKDGGKGWTDEIRSGDRRLMKCPLSMWRSSRKAQNIAGLQLAYGRPYDAIGKPMTAENLIPGFNSGELDSTGIDQTRNASIVSNPAEDLAEVLQGGSPKGNAVVAKIGSRGEK